MRVHCKTLKPQNLSLTCINFGLLRGAGLLSRCCIQCSELPLPDNSSGARTANGATSSSPAMEWEPQAESVPRWWIFNFNFLSLGRVPVALFAWARAVIAAHTCGPTGMSQPPGTA